MSFEMFMGFLGIIFILELVPIFNYAKKGRDTFFEIMTIFSYFFLIVILPFAWFEVGRGYARPDDKLENGTFYRVLGQPHCWQQDGKNECVAILQEGDGNTRLYNIKGKTLENIPTYFIWRSNGRVMEKLPPSLK